jgi:hypothetical protein
MTSQRKTAANQANGRNGRGPRTVAGKQRSSRNGLRHGLSCIGRSNPRHAEEIERIAKNICDDSDPELFELALAIAENEFILRCIRIECVAVVERLRNIWTRALAKGDKSLSLGRAKFRNMKRAFEMLVAFDPTFENKGLMDIWLEMAAVENGSDLGAGRYKLPHNPFPEQRDEADVVQEAWRDLSKLARYERRAWSRRKRSLSAFIDLKVQRALARKLGKKPGPTLT